MASVDLLYQGIHPITGEVYQFSPLEQALTLPFIRRVATARQQGRSGEIDLLGNTPGPMAKRQGSCTFIVPYDGSFRTAAGDPITCYTEAYDELIRQCGHGRPMKLIKRTGHANPQFRNCMARITDIPNKEDMQSMAVAMFTITFELANPRWRGDPSGWHHWDDLNDPDTFWDNANFYWDQNPDYIALTAMPTYHTIDNTGSLEVDDLRIEIVGPVPNLAVYNTTVQPKAGQLMVFAWQEALAANDHLVVDMGAGTVTKNGQNAYDSRFYVPLGQPKWFWLVTGRNDLQVQFGTGTINGTANFIWDTLYG